MRSRRSEPWYDDRHVHEDARAYPAPYTGMANRVVELPPVCETLLDTPTLYPFRYSQNRNRYTL